MEGPARHHSISRRMDSTRAAARYAPWVVVAVVAGCGVSAPRPSIPGAVARPAAAMPGTPEVIRSANRLLPNEGRSVVLEGIAVNAAGQTCIRLDRSDALVSLGGRAPWRASAAGTVVRGHGVLRRIAEQNSPTGIASLALAWSTVEPMGLPEDGRIRDAPSLERAEGTRVEVEGRVCDS